MEHLQLQGGNSPRDAQGKLRLVPNALTYTSRKVTSEFIETQDGWGHRPSDASLGGYYPSVNWAKYENIVLAKSNGKLKGDKAGLGVSAYTWRQSLDMITNRLNQARNVLNGTERRLRRDPAFRRRAQKWDKNTTSANTVMEIEFGWKPLVSDIHSAFKVLMTDNPHSRFVTRHKGSVQFEETYGPEPLPEGLSRLRQFVGTASMTYQMNVEVTNQNLWLLNKLGLINPATIVWDIIPWSFLYGMVSNVNQVIGSLTETVGLTLTDENITRTIKGKFSEHVSYFPRIPAMPWLFSPNRHTNWAYVEVLDKRRVTGTRPSVSLEHKLPSANLELCFIAGGLMVQQMARVSKLIFR